MSTIVKTLEEQITEATENLAGAVYEVNHQLGGTDAVEEARAALNALEAQRPNNPRHLSRLHLGDTFDFRGDRYRLDSFKQVNAGITRLSDDRKYKLNISAEVTNIQQGEHIPAMFQPRLQPGTVVRTKGTGKLGGKVGIVARVNQTRYLLAVAGEAPILAPFDNVEEVDTAALAAYLSK